MQEFLKIILRPIECEIKIKNKIITMQWFWKELNKLTFKGYLNISSNRLLSI